MATSAPRCSHCGKQRATLKRCSVCKQASYCGAECQNAGWKKHKKRCAPPLPPKDVWGKVRAAHADGDWKGVLEWEGRLDEMLKGQSDAMCNDALGIFIAAHGSGLTSTGSTDHALSANRLLEQRVDLLGQMERFRDRGNHICAMASNLILLDRREDAAKLFERARDVGAAHGFFSVECSACEGLGRLEMDKGRAEVGLELLQNALVAARLGEDENTAWAQELGVLGTLIPALFETNAIDELEPPVLRFREAAEAASQREGRLCYWELSSLLASARLHQVLRTPIPF